MSDSEQMMTRYLLGELSEAEQATLEEQYFTDARVFEQLLQSESELLDRYARNQLSAQTRERFEQSYLTHPKRRERTKFAEALATRLDQMEASAGSVAREPVWTVSLWQRLILALRDRRPILGFSLALASLLLVVGAVWFFIAGSRSRQELAQSQAVQADQQRRARELEQQAAVERKRAEELTAQLDHGSHPQQQSSPQTVATPNQKTRVVPTFASLVLTVGGVRGGETGKTPTLVLPAGTAEARLQLNLKEHDYTGYRLSLQAVGGPEIFSRAGLKPRITRSGASFVFTVPAHKFANGDYILTLRGVSQGGELEDLSKSIFRVEKR